MIITLIEFNGGALRDVEYVRIGPGNNGSTWLQVKKPGAPEKTQIEIRQIKLIIARGRTLMPASAPDQAPRAEEIRTFLEQ